MIFTHAGHNIFDFKHEAVIFEVEWFALVHPNSDTFLPFYLWVWKTLVSCLQAVYMEKILKQANIFQ